jgi:hypothetical protein
MPPAINACIEIIQSTNERNIPCDREKERELSREDPEEERLGGKECITTWK